MRNNVTFLIINNSDHDNYITVEKMSNKQNGSMITDLSPCLNGFPFEFRTKAISSYRSLSALPHIHHHTVQSFSRVIVLDSSLQFLLSLKLNSRQRIIIEIMSRGSKKTKTRALRPLCQSLRKCSVLLHLPIPTVSSLHCSNLV